MFFEITQEDVKQTIEYPDKIMECKKCSICCYLRKIKGKRELLVITERTDGTNYAVKCFEWANEMFYPSVLL